MWHLPLAQAEVQALKAQMAPALPAPMQAWTKQRPKQASCEHLQPVALLLCLCVLQ